jgi:hypothetical protein
VGFKVLYRNVNLSYLALMRILTTKKMKMKIQMVKIIAMALNRSHQRMRISVLSFSKRIQK